MAGLHHFQYVFQEFFESLVSFPNHRLIKDFDGLRTFSPRLVPLALADGLLLLIWLAQKSVSIRTPAEIVWWIDITIIFQNKHPRILVKFSFGVTPVDWSVTPVDRSDLYHSTLECTSLLHQLALCLIPYKTFTCQRYITQNAIITIDRVERSHDSWTMKDGLENSIVSGKVFKFHRRPHALDVHVEVHSTLQWSIPKIKLCDVRSN